MPDKSYTQIMVGRAMAGLIGLREALEELAQEGLPADAPDVGARLVEAIRRDNYVPSQAVADYEAALAREYSRYVRARASGAPSREWRDPRRGHIPWFPAILSDRCDGCGECVRACPSNVLGWSEDHTLVLVLEPYACAPGCQLCAKACRPHAVVMPPADVLRRPTESLRRST